MVGKSDPTSHNYYFEWGQVSKFYTPVQKGRIDSNAGSKKDLARL